MFDTLLHSPWVRKTVTILEAADEETVCEPTDQSASQLYFDIDFCAGGTYSGDDLSLVSPLSLSLMYFAH